MGLLDLPSELLFQIIHLIAFSPLPNPTGQRSRYRGNLFGRGSTGRTTLCCPYGNNGNQYGQPNLLNVLLTNWRLHSEVLLYTSKAPQVLRIDVADMDNHWIWPTWRTIPCRNITSVLDKIEINLICCYDVNESHANWNNDLNPCRTLIYAFAPRGIPIREFKINIDTSYLANEHMPLSEDVIPVRKVEDLNHLDFDGLYPVPAQISHNHLHALYTNAESDMRKVHLRSIYEGIDKIVLCMNGKVSTVVRPDT